MGAEMGIRTKILVTTRCSAANPRYKSFLRTLICHVIIILAVRITPFLSECVSTGLPVPRCIGERRRGLSAGGRRRGTELVVVKDGMVVRRSDPPWDSAHSPFNVGYIEAIKITAGVVRGVCGW